MVDNEKQEHLANARRKLKKFRDQQQRQNGGDDLTSSMGTNGNGAHIINGASSDFVFDQKLSEPKDVASFVEEQQAILNQLHQSLSKSPIVDLEEQNRQYELLLESQKQQRARLEEQCQFGMTNNMSGRSSQSMFDNDPTRQFEQRYRRELDHLQEQLEIHVQTIGILVAEKTDLSAKLTQASKQIERKQSEVDEIAGRLKASRERVDELERYSLNSSSSAQRREMEVKEFDKEVDRLKMENSRQNQTIDELKQALTEVENKFKQRQITMDELNNEVSRLKQKLEQADIRLQQFQSVNDMSLVDSYEQRIDDLKQLVHAKSNEIEVILSMNKQFQFDNDQLKLQHQQYIGNVQRHIQELNEQIRQLTESNMFLQNQEEIVRKSYETRIAELTTDQNQIKSSINTEIVIEKDSLRDENESLKSTINDWSIKFQSMRVENEKLTNEIIEKDQQLLRLNIDMERFRESAMEHEKLLETIQEDKATISRALAQNKQLKEQLVELQDGFVKLSNENMNLATRFQAQEHLNKQLEERLTHEHHPNAEQLQTSVEDRNTISNDSNAEEINTLAKRVDELTKENNRLKTEIHRLVQKNPAEEVDETNNESTPVSSSDFQAEEKTVLEKIFVEKIIDRFNRAMRDNADLQDRTQQMEHLILQLQSETETIGDYISLYQQQRQQLSRRYQEKDDYIKQLTQERLNLQRKLSELESILMGALNKSSNNIPTTNSNSISTINVVSQTISTEQLTDENEWPDMIDNPVESAPIVQSDELRTTENRSENVHMQSIESSTLEFDGETKQRILTLLKEIGEVDSSSKVDHPSTTKLAFIGKNLYVCSTCTGPVQWV